jgi:rRNA processing protein Gar1
LKSLGQLNFFTRTGQLLIRSKELPNMYSNIGTSDRKIVGKVNDIIGPIMDPHIVVRPTKEVLDNPGLVREKELFELPKKNRNKRDKRWKKKGR